MSGVSFLQLQDEASSLDRLSKAVYSRLLDYRVTAPPRVAACIKVLLKIMANVLDHPDEETYRQVLLRTRLWVIDAL